MIGSVSVVLSSYGHYDHLEPCLTALDLQTTAPVDVLVVDDGGDIEACKAVCERHRNITLVEKPRSVVDGVEVNGMAASINIGVGLARGDVVLIIQRDHVLAADYISRLLAYWELGCVFFGLTHRIPWVPSNEWVVLQREMLHIPDGEERFRLLAGTHRFNAEFNRWGIVDGMDFAVERAGWQPMNENPAIFYSVQQEWALRMQFAGYRFIVNPMLKLWHVGIDNVADDAINAAVAASTKAVCDMYGNPSLFQTFPIRFADVHAAITRDEQQEAAQRMHHIVEGVVF